jgi:hypothetical protein
LCAFVKTNIAYRPKEFCDVDLRNVELRNIAVALADAVQPSETMHESSHSSYKTPQTVSESLSVDPLAETADSYDGQLAISFDFVSIPWCNPTRGWLPEHQGKG